MFADKTQVDLNAAEYDLQPILMQLELGIPLLLLPTLDQSEIALNVSPEWSKNGDRSRIKNNHLYRV
jgi:hypothetical protein